MVKEDRRAFPSSSSELDDDDDAELVRKKLVKPNLRWKDSQFQDQTLAALNQMRKHRHFCDVTLQLGKQDFPAHRVVLAAASPYLMELFTSEEDQPSRKEIQGGILYELNGGFTKEALEKLIDYAYTARLDVPGEHVKPVYLAALRLKMDRAAAECARFLASHLDLGSCLEIRSVPGVTNKTKTKPENEESKSKVKERKSSKDSTKNGSNNSENGEQENGNNGNSESPENGAAVEENAEPGEQIDLVTEVDKFIAANVELLRDSRQLRALPRLQVEVLHVSKEERESALMQPLCELILDWYQRQWVDDGSLTLDNFSSKRYLLFMAPDNTLQDCDGIAEGSAIDSEIIQDYKKGNQMHLQMNPSKISKKQRRLTPAVKPAKPREMLYTRHINQHEEGDEQSEEWKIIASHKLDDQSILAVASLDGQLATLSIMQRINKPNDPVQVLIGSMDPMSRSVSNGSLADSTVNAGKSSRSPRMSRPESIEKESFVPVAPMSQAKCAVGAECWQGKLLVCGGYDRGECLNLVEVYNVETNTWTSLPSMKHNRGRFDITCVDSDIVYAVAGSNGHAEIASVEKYDSKVGKWSKVASLPVNLSNIGVCSLNGVVYCVGGTHGPSGTKYCFRLTEDEKSWERIANLNIGRFQAAVTCFQGKIWAVGGCDGWNPLNSVEIYDPSTNTWKIGPNLTTARRGCGLAVRNGKLILVGGNDGTHSLCTTEILDPFDNVWTPGPTMTTCRTNVAVAMVGNRLWAVGGFSGKSFLNTVEYLDPFTDEWTTFIPVDKIDFPEEEDDDDAANVVDNDCDDVDQEIEISNADDVETSKSVTPTDDFDDDAKLASLGENVTNDDIPDLEEVNQAQPSCIDDAVEGVQDEAVVAIDVEGVHNDDVAIDVVSVENGATAVDSDE